MVDDSIADSTEGNGVAKDLQVGPNRASNVTIDIDLANKEKSVKNSITESLPIDERVQPQFSKALIMFQISDPFDANAQSKLKIQIQG